MKTLKMVLVLSLAVWYSASAGMKPVALFSPADQPARKMLDLIWNAKKSIYMAMYFLTDHVIADTLIEAKKKKKDLDIKIVVDPISVENRYGKAKYLAERGIEVFVFNPEIGRKKKDLDIKVVVDPISMENRSGKAKHLADYGIAAVGFNPDVERKNAVRWSNDPIMHNKYIIFDEKTLWTGSLNATEKANNDNCENVLVLESSELCVKYRNNFIDLMACSFAFAEQDTDERHQSSLRQKISNMMTNIKDDAALVTALQNLAQTYNAEEAVGG